jgi:hypothetical protein
MIQSGLSAAVVHERLGVWSREWRESHLLPELRALGYLAWPLTSVGRTQYLHAVHAQWPLHAFEGRVTVTVEDDATGSFLRCELEVRPNARAILRWSVVFALLVAGYNSVAADPLGSPLALGAGAFALMFLALVTLRPIATRHLNKRLAGIATLLRAALAAEPPASTP